MKIAPYSGFNHSMYDKISYPGVYSGRGIIFGKVYFIAPQNTAA
jgi:gamma-glutamylcyclotransferase (GGCT)/AIG2-like uncharacterized protein YtfP